MNIKINKKMKRIINLTLVMFTTLSSFGQTIFKTESNVLTMTVNNKVVETPQLDPDVFYAVCTQKINKVTFKTNKDSISFNVKMGQKIDFVVQDSNNEKTNKKVIGVPKAATFSKKYITKYNNQTIVEIPEVYELVNIAIALTNTGIQDSGLVIHDSPYYNDVMKWFGNFKNEKIIANLDSALLNEPGYTFLKTNSYCFDFKNQKIVRSKVYDREPWLGINALLPYINDLQKFSEKTNFKKFYKDHKNFYETQISYYRDTLNINEMVQWLKKNFPPTTFNCTKIVFSPLVGYNQNAQWYEDNGFKEAQAHVNFPYPNSSYNYISEKSNQLRNASIVFTELNHPYIYPVSKKYLNTSDFQMAFSDLSKWETEGTPAALGYATTHSCFDEYMNWALVSLRYVDFAPTNEFELLVIRLEKFMKEWRGFSKFPEFNRNLIKLYKERKNGETIADLYPAIIKWCKDEVK
jgi:hypothetical protein